MTENFNRFFPRNLYFVAKDGVENPPKSFENWQYPREAYTFLLFDDRCYPVARSSVRDLAALTASPYFKDKLWFQLPQGTSEADFLTFYFFLVYGTYPPSLKELNAAFDPYGLTTQSPPKIEPYDANAPTQVILLITAFLLGKDCGMCHFVHLSWKDSGHCVPQLKILLQALRGSMVVKSQETSCQYPTQPNLLILNSENGPEPGSLSNFNLLLWVNMKRVTRPILAC